MRNDNEVYDQIDKASKALNKGGIYPGMTYEDGVKAALLWMLENTEELPMPGEDPAN